MKEAGASQFDALRALLAAGFRPPGPLFTLAGAGRGFHGQRGRTWAAAPGNLHLCAALCPVDLPAEHALALTMLPAVAAVDAIAGVGGGVAGAGIKWVNDIVLAGGKVGGVLTAAQTLDGRVGWAVLGIGLNVAVAPDVSPTPFVPAVGCLASYRSGLTLCEVLSALLRALAHRCRELERVGPAPLLAAYRAASVIIGRQVSVWPEEADGAATTGRPRARGVVQAINGDLSLTLAGEPEPVRVGAPRHRGVTAGTGSAPSSLRGVMSRQGSSGLLPAAFGLALACIVAICLLVPRAWVAWWLVPYAERPAGDGGGRRGPLELLPPPEFPPDVVSAVADSSRGPEVAGAGHARSGGAPVARGVGGVPRGGRAPAAGRSRRGQPARAHAAAARGAAR